MVGFHVLQRVEEVKLYTGSVRSTMAQMYID